MRNEPANVKPIREIKKLALSKKWCFEHVVFYLTNILGLPLNEVNKLLDDWDL